MLGEEGKISKQAVLSVGALLTGSVMAASVAQAAHSSVSSIEFTPPATEKAIHTSAHTSAPAHSSSGAYGGCSSCGAPENGGLTGVVSGACHGNGDFDGFQISDGGGGGCTSCSCNGCLCYA